MMTENSLGSAFLAEHISTPLAGAVTVVPHEEATTAAQRLRDYGFDQAPVVDGDARPLGWFHAPQSPVVGKVIDHFMPLHRSRILGSSTPIGEIIPVIERTTFVFTAGPTGIEGFMVPSDLDRHACRTYLYLLISEVEMRLSKWLRIETNVPMVEVLSAMTREEEKRFARAKRDNVDVHPVEYLGLQTLVRLFTKTAGRDQVEDTLKSDLGLVGQIRNEIMHPTRSLASREGPPVGDVEQAARRALVELRSLGH